MKTTNVQKYLVYLLVFLLPCNLAYHWILPSSYVQGILVDYLIPTFYLTDILIFALLGIWIYQLIRSKKKFLFCHKSKYFLFLILFILANIAIAKNQLVAIYKWLKLGEMGLLLIYIKNITIDKKDVSRILHILSLSVLWQSILAIAQWIKQSNIFPYWLMGESQFSTATAHVKTINWFGQLKVIPMGTFPHPNILAGWLALSLLLLVMPILVKHKNKKSHQNSKTPQNNKNCQTSQTYQIKNLLISLSDRQYKWVGANRDRNKFVKISCVCWVKIFVLILGAVALFLTFSLPAWGVFLVCLLVVVLRKLNIKRFVKIGFMGLVATGLMWGMLNFIQPESWERRVKLAEIAGKMWLSSSIVGIGLNNFTVRMPEFGEIVANIRFLQPVHNVPLLILVETGLLGLVLLFLWIVKSIKKYNNFERLLKLPMFYVLGSMFFLSLFDHYFLSTQQGLLIIVMLGGLNLFLGKIKNS